MEGSFTLEARNVGVAASQRRLLEGVSLTIAPSQLVCIMGPSGAGKTTLLTALNGYVRPSTGAVLLNGIDLHANFVQFAGCIGYVPQDDIVHRELTVREALSYSAKLRLVSGRSSREINSRVSAVLEMLGLSGTQAC
jgi:ABC-type multidrug transport system ATPase subunit